MISELKQMLIKFLNDNALRIKAHKGAALSAFIFVLLIVYILSINTAKLFPSLEVDRKVLSTLVFSPSTEAPSYQVLKVKIRNKIMLEIYKIINEYNYELVSQIDTGTKYEGYFLLGGSATNLAYINIDDDPMNEIIVPGFDNGLMAHLNVIKFDSTSGSFTLVNQKVSAEIP